MSKLIVPGGGGLITAAPRLPPKPTHTTGNPFDALGDVVADCGVEGCGWHAMGPRPLVKKAWDEHYRQHHAAAAQTGVVLLNHPRQ